MDLGRILISMGANPSNKGFGYICYAVQFYREHMNDPSITFSDIYSKITAITGSSQASIHRSIERTIERIDQKSEAYKKYVPIERKYVTVTEFISTLAYTTKGESER